MERLSLLLVVMLAAVPPVKRLDTIEAAEAHAASRGIVMTEKVENIGQAIAPRAFDYKLGNTEIGITQFATRRAAKTWCDLATAMPGLFGDVVCNGLIAFQVIGGEDSERQAVVSALKGKTTYQPVGESVSVNATTAPSVDAPTPSVSSNVALPSAHPVGVLPPDMRGYQDVLWGMSVTDVKSRYPDIEFAKDGQGHRKSTVAGFEAYLTFQFKNKKLKRVLIAFDASNVSGGLSRREVNEAILGALKTKYGPAKIPKGELRNDPRWENGESLVALLDGVHGPVIGYESKKLVAEVEEIPTDGL